MVDNLAVVGKRCRGARGGERGELLVETVAAVAIIGVAVVGLVAALGTTFHFSTVSRVDGRGDLLLVRYAEALSAVPYEACHAGTTPYTAAAVSAIPSSGLPAGVSTGPWGSGDGTSRTFQFTVESTTYWNGDTGPATFSSACGATDRGSEALHTRVCSGDGTFDRRLTVVKRAA